MFSDKAVTKDIIDAYAIKDPSKLIQFKNQQIKVIKKVRENDSKLSFFEPRFLILPKYKTDTM